MTTHKLKRIHLKKRSKKHTHKSKKERTKKYHAKGGLGANYIFRGIDEKDTAVDIVKTLCDYDPNADNPIYYRFEFFVSQTYLQTVQSGNYTPVRNKVLDSNFISAIPLSGEEKVMIISSIYENRIKTTFPDDIAETDFENFSNNVFNILKLMDKANFSIYGDAILLCKQVTLANGTFGPMMGDSGL